MLFKIRKIKIRYNKSLPQSLILEKMLQMLTKKIH